VWYPAESSDAVRMTVRGYLSLSATETSFGKPRVTLAAQEWITGMTSTLDMHLRAIRDARLVAGKFPVVIYAPGGSQTSWENADLCEYLASFGYVVIASPSLGTKTRSMTYDLEGANTQARDIRFLLDYAEHLPNAAGSPRAVAGSSWGAMSGLFAAARDKRIGALVALDGSIRYYPGLVTLAGDVHPETMSIPLICFIQGDYSLEAQARSKDRALREGPNVLLEWTYGDLIVAHMLGLAHASFSSMWQRRDDYWSAYGSPTWQPGDYSREDAVTAYEWVAQYTVKFLDAYLKSDSEALSFLKRPPVDNGVPTHVMSINFNDRTGVLHSYEGFRAEIGRRGFSHVLEIYTAFQKEDPRFTLEEASVTDWAEELIADERRNEAVALLRFNEQIHADSSQAEVTLGDAYRLWGNKPAAAECYQRAIGKDPTNRLAAVKLSELAASR